MALSQSALSELLEAFRAGEGVDLVRESVRMVMQELIDAEAAERIGAGLYERTESRVTERNGTRPRLVTTQAGDVGLRIPKLRKGSFFPVILEPRRRIDQALYAVVMEAYVQGISTRSVDDLAEAMGIDSGISKSEVSRICAGLDETVGAFRTRPLDHVEFPYVYLDATYLHVRNSAQQVVSMAVVVATGVTATGTREILGLDVGDSEDEVFWKGFMTTLKQRGLAGVRLVISDQHSGLVAHPHARSIESMPGFGPVLGAMLLTAAGDLSGYPDPGHLAAAAGLVPVPKDSGRRVGNVHKPRRYSRPLRHALYLSALSSLRTDGANRDYYQKKRAAGRTHKQALIALARRRVDVLWALIRDHRTYIAQPPLRARTAA